MGVAVIAVVAMAISKRCLFRKALRVELPFSSPKSFLRKDSHSRNLRSSSMQLLEQPRSFTRTYGDKAFSVCSPKLRNSLQSD